MCGLTVNVVVRVPEEAAVGVAAGLMQGKVGVFAEQMQERHLWVFGEYAYRDTSRYRAIIAMIHNSRVADLELWRQKQ